MVRMPFSHSKYANKSTAQRKLRNNSALEAIDKQSTEAKDDEEKENRPHTEILWLQFNCKDKW